MKIPPRPGAAVLLLAATALAFAGCRADAPVLPDGVADEASPADLVAQLAELLPRVERLSGLERVGELRMRRQSREDARRHVEQRLDRDLPPERLDGVHRAYAALGLVPDTLDLRALLLDLYSEQVLGYYDPDTRTLFVLEGEEAVGLRPLLAHELVHALQDQHANLDSLVSHERGNDRQTAAHAALEGHAMVVMFAVLAEEATRRRLDPTTLPDPSPDPGEALAAQNEAFPVFGRAPDVIRETLLFPYIHGARFVHQLWSSMAPLERYPAPMDSLLPQSTHQIMEPRAFLAARREPVELRFHDVPAGREPVYENTLGRLETGIFLAAHGGADARDVASGWLGDRFLLLTDSAASDVLHWVTVWQDEAAADAFLQVLVPTPASIAPRTMHAYRGAVGDHAAVHVVIAPADTDPLTLAPPPVSATGQTPDQ